MHTVEYWWLETPLIAIVFDNQATLKLYKVGTFAGAWRKKERIYRNEIFFKKKNEPWWLA